MEYLEAAWKLRSLINETNKNFLVNKQEIQESPRRMRVVTEKTGIKELIMDDFNNSYVRKNLKELEQPEAFVVCDIASMDIKGKTLNYILYKGYHSTMEKGWVLYQPLEEESLQPFGSLEFSNAEENIFFQVSEPDAEESTCNAMETDKVIENGKSIVFFIGHMDEERLIYDIQRLIVDTVNNVSKHPALKFEVIVQYSVYGGNVSGKFLDQIHEIDRYTREEMARFYTNISFEFIYEQDGEPD